MPTVQLRGPNSKGAEVKLDGAMPGTFQRFIITIKGREVTVKANGKEARQLSLPSAVPVRGALGLRDTGGAVEFMNLYVREL